MMPNVRTCARCGKDLPDTTVLLNDMHSSTNRLAQWGYRPLVEIPTSLSRTGGGVGGDR